MKPRNLLGALAGFSAWAGVLACSSATPSDDSCTNLLSCCEQLSPADQQPCAQLASAGSDTLCAAELTTYQASGCGVSRTLPEAGTKTDSGLGSGPGTGACAALSACCAATALPSTDVAACHTYLTTDDNTLCASALTTFSGAGYCGSASSDAGHSGDSGAVTQLDAGSGTGSGPAILSLSANPTTVSPTSAAIISAVVSDSAGVETLAGGTLIDEATGTVYGNFATPGGQGTFQYTVTWDALNGVTPVTTTAGGTVVRSVLAKFFDNAGHTAEQALTLSAGCDEASSIAACSGTCLDVSDDLDDCGACGNACGPGLDTCTGGVCGCSDYEIECNGACSNKNAAETCGSCSNDCTSYGSTATCEDGVCHELGDGPASTPDSCADVCEATGLACHCGESSDACEYVVDGDVYTVNECSQTAYAIVCDCSQ